MVTIIGAGLAGLSAAISLAERGIPSNLVSQQPSERAQSVLAEGGINAALDTMGEGDTWQEHFADTMRGGCDLADPNAVAGLTSHAPEIVRWLAGLGVPFAREDGRMVQRSFGGQKKKRTAYAKSSTGKALMTALIDEARKYEAAGLIHRLPHHELIGLTVENGVCIGARLWDTYTDTALRCGAPVVLACGGLNGLFPGMTTGTVYNTGGAAALAFAKGAALANPEMIQYHPTTVQISGKRMLVSEAARGEGGRLCVMRSGKPWYFMEELYPELGNLMPRDVVSRTMADVVTHMDCGDQAYLDMTGLDAEIWRRRLPDLRAELIHYLALDPKKTPIPVNPGIHFFMGGLYVDERHRTTISGLYAAGECACQYHGANRLGGNSMLAAIYGGRIAARNVSADAAGSVEKLRQLSDEERESLTVSPRFSLLLRDALSSGLGMVRSEAGMARAGRSGRARTANRRGARARDAGQGDAAGRAGAKRKPRRALPHRLSGAGRGVPQDHRCDACAWRNRHWFSSDSREEGGAVTITVLRRSGANAQPEWKQYDYHPESGQDTVATALTRLNETLDDPIRWECSCLQKKCGACAMVINGIPKLACDAFLRDYKNLRLEPLRKFPVVADLIVDRGVMREHLQALKLWFEGEARSNEKSNEIAYEASRCLQCGCCLEVCPNYKPDGIFTGMAGGVPMARLLAELPEEQREEASRLYRERVFEGCGKSLSCRNVCPAGLDVDGLLVNSNALAVWKRYFGREI